MYAFYMKSLCGFLNGGLTMKSFRGLQEGGSLFYIFVMGSDDLVALTWWILSRDLSVMGFWSKERRGLLVAGDPC